MNNDRQKEMKLLLQLKKISLRQLDSVVGGVIVHERPTTRPD